MAKQRNHAQVQIPHSSGTLNFNDAIEAIRAKTYRTLGDVARLVQCASYEELRSYLRGKKNPSPELIKKVSLELERVCS